MIVRALNSDSDWTFGRGRNDYLRDLLALTQQLKTRLRSFLGNCFFDQTAGVDWFNLLGAKDQAALNLNISAVILNTPGVTGMVQLSANVDLRRNILIQYVVTTAYTGSIPQSLGFLLSEQGDFLTDEQGDRLHA